MKFHLIQFKWYRKLMGGSYYYVDYWGSLPFWTDELMNGIYGERIIKEEHYRKKK